MNVTVFAIHGNHDHHFFIIAIITIITIMTKPEPTNGEDGGDGSNKNRATRGQHHVRTLKAKGSGNTEKVESHENNDKVKVGERKHVEMTLTGSDGDSSCQSCVLKMLHREPGAMCQDDVVDDDYDNDGDDDDDV